MQRTSFAHEFVEYVPPEPVEGVLYVSIPYATAVHRCACGCGNKVVTPISPAQWHLVYDGDSVSLSPSIGNWGFPCQSHYWIRRNEVRWAGRWSDREIAEGRRRDTEEIESYLTTGRAQTAEVAMPTPPSRLSVLDRLLRLIGLR